MIRFLHLADLHLGAEPRALGPVASRRARDYLEAFERAVSFATAPENRIQAVVIAGDFFDSAVPSMETRRFATAQLKRLARAQVPVVVAPGNHDAICMPASIYADPDSKVQRLVHLAASPNVSPVVTLTLNGEQVSFYGMAWDPFRSRPPYEVFRCEGRADYHVAVLHATLENARLAELHSRDVPLNLEGLAGTGMDYIALGHVHTPQEHYAGSVPVVYPGTLEARRFTPGEAGERHLVVVELEKGQRAEIQRHPWNRRTLLTESLDLDVEVVDGEEDLLELIRGKYADPDTLLRLELTGTTPFLVDPEALSDRLSGDFFFLDLLDRTDLFDTSLVASWAQEQTIRGLYVRKLQARMAVAADDEERQCTELALKLAVKAFSERGGH